MPGHGNHEVFGMLVVELTLAGGQTAGGVTRRGHPVTEAPDLQGVLASGLRDTALDLALGVAGDFHLEVERRQGGRRQNKDAQKRKVKSMVRLMSRLPGSRELLSRSGSTIQLGWPLPGGAADGGLRRLPGWRLAVAWQGRRHREAALKR